MGDAAIIAKVGGRQRRLSTPKQWRAAIANDDIARDTPITYEPGSGQQTEMLAGGCPDLIPLFAEILGPGDTALAPHSEQPASDELAAEDAYLALDPAALSSPEAAPQADPEATYDYQPEDEPKDEPETEFEDDVVFSGDETGAAQQSIPATNSNAGLGKVIFGIFLTLLLVGLLAKCADNGATSTNADVVQLPSASMAASDAAANIDDPSTWQTMYGVNPLNIRISPSGTSRLITTLPRATELTGVIVPGGNDKATNWFLIKQGPQTGRYVSAVNLSSTAPPEIDATSAGDYYVIDDADPLMTAAEGSSTIDDSKQKFHAGQKVKTNGTIGSYAEVGLNQGGVGYLPVSNLSTTKPLPLDGTGEGGDEAQATIAITNRCQSRLKIGIYYHADGQWHDNGNMTWIWRPETTSHPSVTSSDEQRIRTDRGEIYIVIFERDGTSYYNGESGDSRITYGGRSVQANEYNADRNSEGSYQVSVC